jgi:hypothetical protein
MQELNSLTVECLPDGIPANVTVDLDHLTERDQAIRVGDIALGEEVAVLSDPELVVVKISSRPKEEVEKIVAEAVEAEEAEEVVEAVETPPLEEESKEEQA